VQGELVVIGTRAGRPGPAVVARGAIAAGASFDLSPALAQELGVAGETAVRWRFASRAGRHRALR
jgi:hypothetical protein